MRDRVIEITEVRVIALGEGNVSARLVAPTGAAGGPYATRAIYFAGTGCVDTPIYRRDLMPQGTHVAGPALIEEMDSTTLLHPGNVAAVRADGSLVIDVSDAAGAHASTSATRNRPAPERDPTTLTVVSNALRNISDEMGSAMVRTAYSPIFSESRDFPACCSTARCA